MSNGVRSNALIYSLIGVERQIAGCSTPSKTLELGPGPEEFLRVGRRQNGAHTREAGTTFRSCLGSTLRCVCPPLRVGNGWKALPFHVLGGL